MLISLNRKKEKLAKASGDTRAPQKKRCYCAVFYCSFSPKEKQHSCSPCLCEARFYHVASDERSQFYSQPALHENIFPSGSGRQHHSYSASGPFQKCNANFYRRRVCRDGVCSGHRARCRVSEEASPPLPFLDPQRHVQLNPSFLNDRLLASCGGVWLRSPCC